MNEPIITEERLKELYTLIKKLFGAYPHVATDKTNVAVYASKLAKCDPADLETAIDQIIDTRTFPNVSDIFEVLNEIRQNRAKMKASNKDEILKWKKEYSSEVEGYLYALNHNIAVRQQKEEPLLKALTLAKKMGFSEDRQKLLGQIASIRENHKVVADQISYEYGQARPISYLKEIKPMSENKNNPSNSVGSIAASILAQNMTVEVK